MATNSLEERVGLGTRVARFLDRHRGKMYVAWALIWTAANAIQKLQSYHACTPVDASYADGNGGSVVEYNYGHHGTGAVGGQRVLFDTPVYAPVGSCQVIEKQVALPPPGADPAWELYHGESIRPDNTTASEVSNGLLMWLAGLIVPPFLVEVARNKVLERRIERAR